MYITDYEILSFEQIRIKKLPRPQGNFRFQGSIKHPQNIPADPLQLIRILSGQILKL